MKTVVTMQNLDPDNFKETSDLVGFNSDELKGKMQPLKFNEKQIQNTTLEFFPENNLIDIGGNNKLTYYRFSTGKFEWVVGGGGTVQTPFESNGLITSGFLLGNEYSKSLSDNWRIYTSINVGISQNTFKKTVEIQPATFGGPAAIIKPFNQFQPALSIDIGSSWGLLKVGIKSLSIGNYKTNDFREIISGGIEQPISPYKIDKKMKPKFYIGRCFSF